MPVFEQTIKVDFARCLDENINLVEKHNLLVQDANDLRIRLKQAKVRALFLKLVECRFNILSYYHLFILSRPAAIQYHAVMWISCFFLHQCPQMCEPNSRTVSLLVPSVFSFTNTPTIFYRHDRSANYRTREAYNRGALAGGQSHFRGQVFADPGKTPAFGAVSQPTATWVPEGMSMSLSHIQRQLSIYPTL